MPIDEPIESVSEVARANDDDIEDGAVLQTRKRARLVQPGPRRQERLESARKALSNWCQTLWNTAYSHCVWGPDVLLLDTVLTKLASRARIKTVSDIKNEVPEWLWADDYGDVVLKLLEPIDSAWHEENERKKMENKAKRAKISADKKVKREEDRLEKSRQATEERRAPLAHHLGGPGYPGSYALGHAYHPSSHTYHLSPTLYAHAYHPSTHIYHPSSHVYHPSSHVYHPSTEAYHPRLVPSTEAYQSGTEAYQPGTEAYQPGTEVYQPSTHTYQPSQAYDTSVQPQQSGFSCFPLATRSDMGSVYSYSSTPQAGSTGMFHSFQLPPGNLHSIVNNLSNPPC